MDDSTGRLHPLVAEAHGQVASFDRQIEYWLEVERRNLERDGLSEEMRQRLEDLYAGRDDRRGMLQRLTEKLNAAEVEAL